MTINSLDSSVSTDLKPTVHNCEVPSRGINRFWEACGDMIFSCVNSSSLPMERSDGIHGREYGNILQPRIIDQLQKINLVYRLVKTTLEQHECDHNDFNAIISKAYDHFAFLQEKNQRGEPKDFYESSEYDFRNKQISSICDSVVSFMIHEARKIEGIKGVLSENLLEEVFSAEVAENSIDSNFGDRTLSEFPWCNMSFTFDRHISRDIEDLDAICYEAFFQEKFNAGDMSAKEVRKELNKLKLAYGLAKWKFHGIERETGGRYFEHLRAVVQILLDNYQTSIKFDDIIAAMLHDIVEDTNISLSTIKTLFGEKVALIVSLLTKKSELNFIDPDTDKENAKSIQKSGILNNNLLPNDRIKSLLRNIPEECKIDIKSRKFSIGNKTTLVACGLTLNEVEGIELFNQIAEEKKGEKKEEFFSKFLTIRKVTSKAEDESNRLGLDLNEDEIGDCAYSAVQIKLSDTFHNLGTMWDLTIDFKMKKVREAISYILRVGSMTSGTIAKIVTEKVDEIIESIQQDDLDRTELENTYSKLKSEREELQNFVEREYAVA